MQTHRPLVRRRLTPLLIAASILASATCARERPRVAVPIGGSVAGAIASAEQEATAAGLDILASGGNAADAAVTVALALAVVHPQAGNLGGGGFAVVRKGGTVETLDFRETAPAAARRNMFTAPDGTALEDASLIGPLAAGVPGSPTGLFELHKRYGRLPWVDVVGPALRLARDGFAVSPRLHQAIAWEKDSLARFPETASVWLPGGQPPAAGSHIVLPALAATLADYAERGPAAITSGRVAAAIEEVSRRYGGILTAADIASYRPVWRPPVRFRAFGFEVASMPLPSSGGIILAETLLMLERLGYASLPTDSVERAHLQAETWRRAYADRFILGDPAATEATPEQLLDSAWLAFRSAGIDRRRATPSPAVKPWDAAALATAGATTHLSVIDARGLAVSLTTTLNGWFGCYLQVPGAGFLLNNEMDDFTTIPGHPNLYGLIQGGANAVVPGRRMLSSMTPTIAWNSRQTIALGSPGGSRIPTATAQVLLSLIVDHMSLRDAVARPRIHHQWLPDEIVYEEGALSGEAMIDLQHRGHTLRKADWHVGEVDAVRWNEAGGFEAAADSRGPGGSGVAPEGVRSE